MKIYIFVLICIGLFIISCEDEKANCNALITASNEAYLAYEEDVADSSLCVVNLAAYQAALAAECTGFTATEDTLFQEACDLLTYTTYTFTAAVGYNSADCTGDGFSGYCVADPTALTESDCGGYCADYILTNESACEDADQIWTSFWHDIYDLMSDGESISFILHADGTYTVFAAPYCAGNNNNYETQNECEDAGLTWDDGIVSGTWVGINNTIVFSDDEAPDESETLTYDGTSLILIQSGIFGPETCVEMIFSI